MKIEYFAIIIGGVAMFLSSCDSPMDSPPPTAAEVRAELATFREYRRERAARGLSTQRADEQIEVRERQLRAIESAPKN